MADPAYNAGEICKGLKEAYAKGAKIIVFPELCITGYTCGDLFRFFVARHEMSCLIELRIGWDITLRDKSQHLCKDVYREMLVKSSSAKLIAGYVYASAGEGESTQDLVFGGHNPQD